MMGALVVFEHLETITIEVHSCVGLVLSSLFRGFYSSIIEKLPSVAQI